MTVAANSLCLWRSSQVFRSQDHLLLHLPTFDAAQAFAPLRRSFEPKLFPCGGRDGHFFPLCARLKLLCLRSFYTLVSGDGETANASLLCIIHEAVVNDNAIIALLYMLHCVQPETPPHVERKHL